MLASDGVVNEFVPDASAVSPVAAAYQSIVCPAPGVADIVTVPDPQRELGPAVGATGSGFTVTVVAADVAVQPLASVI